MNNHDSFRPIMVLGGLAPMLLAVICILLAWWCLQEFRLDLFVRRPRSAQAKLLRILLAVALGYEISRFLMDYIAWSSAWSSALKGVF